ncbi:MAG: GntP family permease [Planctomycetaceae bacterium]|nr:GntP family permease [Planctomycetaceae bacterium]
MTITLLVLLTGLMTVVGGIILLRLPAFVALILAAVFVGTLTSSHLVRRSKLTSKAVVRVGFTDDTRQRITADRPLPVNETLILMLDAGPGTPLTDVASITLERAEEGAEYTVSRLDGEFPAQPSGKEFLIARPADVQVADQLAKQSVMSRVSAALGSSCSDLAIMIAAASIIGTCLLKSGSADRIVQSSLKATGVRGAPLAFAVSGFVLSTPVFFDTVFLLMVPLAASLYRRTKRDYLLYVLAVVTGGTMAHSLVPPTPGPLLIAAEFDVSITSMVIGGSIIGLLASAVGLTFAYWINGRCVLPLRSPDGEGQSESIESSESSGDRRLPSLGVALIPILLPLVLITIGSGYDKETGDWIMSTFRIPAGTVAWLRPFCEKNVALMLGAAAAILAWVTTSTPGRESFGNAMRHSVTSAGTIILVTSAGKAFGQMMQQTSVAELLQQIPASSPDAIVVAAFLVAVAVRTAQGSATVAMLTAAGVFGSLVTSGQAGVNPLYVALAIGCGSKPISWMNDSGFLLITRMSGMTESEGLRYVSPMTAIEGVAGLIFVLIGVHLFPML